MRVSWYGLVREHITGIIEVHVCTKLKWLVHTVSMIRAEVSLGFIWKLPWSGVMEPLAIEGLRIPVIQYTATVPRDPLRTTVSATLLFSVVIKKKIEICVNKRITPCSRNFYSLPSSTVAINEFVSNPIRALATFVVTTNSVGLDTSGPEPSCADE